MKTKHILTAMALPALFAACTAEEIVNEGVATLQERATVENVTVKIGEGAESRYAVEGASTLKFNFETGDKFGAALIDQYDYNNPTKPELWDVIPSLAGNVPFTFNANAGEWKAPEDLPLGIGHYLFVYPYNRADVNRAAVSYELPAVQKLYTKENGEIDLNAAIEAGNKAFYATVLTEADEELEISLKNLYTYPKFVINFDNGEKVTTVSKVVLAKDGGFEVKGGFNHEVVAALFADSDETDFYDAETEATDWNLVQTADVLTTDANYATIETSNYLVAELPNNTKVEEVTNNKSIEVRFMMPGFLMDENLSELADYTMYVYTNNGAYSFVLDKAIEWKKTTKLSAKQKAFARGAANTITIDKDEVVKEKDAPYVVTTIADWNDLVKQYGDNDKFVGSEAIEVAVVGDALVLDETAKMPTEAQFEVTKLAVAGEVELCNIIAEEVEVKKGATLTTCSTLDATKIVNNGTVIVAAEYNKKGNAIACENIDEIVNNATLNVEEDAIAAFKLTNGKKATFNNEGEVEIEGGSSVGDINNEGEIEISSKFIISKNVDKEGEPLTFVNNNGKILASAELENNGYIVNEGTITCRHLSGNIVNKNVIDSKKDAVTYITKNEGEILVYKVNLANNVTVENDAKGTIKYETKGDVDFAISTTTNSLVNYVVATGNLNVKSIGAVSTIEMVGKGTLAVVKNATVDNLIVDNNVTLASNVNVNMLNVKEDAVAHIPAEYTLSINSSLTNNGTIEAYGVLDLTAAKIENGANIGDVEENGSKGEVKYYDPSASQLQAKWNAAVAAWSKAATDEGWYKWYTNNETDFYAGNPYDYQKFYNVAVHDAWKNRDVIAALGTLAEPTYKDGVITNEPSQFKNAVDALLKAQATEAGKVLYDADGKFKISMTPNNVCYQTVAAMYDNMSARLNTKEIITDKYATDAVKAAYVWYAQSTVFAKLNAAQPYAYIWKSTADLACPLYDVCQVIKKADAAGWEKIMGDVFTGNIDTIEEVKLWLTGAAAVENSTTLGKLAKEMADKYYTASLTWGYTTDQATACLASK